jgi:hypothetical protein
MILVNDGVKCKHFLKIYVLVKRAILSILVSTFADVAVTFFRAALSRLTPAPFRRSNTSVSI